MRGGILTVTQEFLCERLGLPKGTVFRNFRVLGEMRDQDWRPSGEVSFVVYHESFPETAEGARYPDVDSFVDFNAQKKKVRQCSHCKRDDGHHTPGCLDGPIPGWCNYCSKEPGSDHDDNCLLRPAKSLDLIDESVILGA